MKRASPVALLVLVACGPSLGQLVEDRHYPEAICAAETARPSPRATVLDALVEDTDLHVHVHVVPDHAVEALLGSGPSTQRVLSTSRLVVVRLRTNAVPVDHLEVRAELSARDPTFGAAPAHLDGLTWATGETSPAPRRYQTYLTGENVLRTLAAIFTLGISLEYAPYRPRTVEDPPTLDDYRQVAPAAAALFEGLPTHGCRSPAPPTAFGVSGVDCTAVYVLDRQGETDWTLDLRMRFEGRRVQDPHASRGPEPCALVHHSHLPLGNTTDLDETVAARFGLAMQPLHARGP